ncbi:MAG: hypothetical protein A3K19_25175 [Lentisphaerae bacterium RIFOXYB12_FULL_65_16]|nr:MAG: hypothetical protein A3K18_07280 [Lentisphaerae bacterium RIFOXYA12_64_32]OGV91114.1 MAG: hypothetical protein A3K19_25175 [Lentisphaerae bacterium RIFOXYB12_FULL_65_16]
MVKDAGFPESTFRRRVAYRTLGVGGAVSVSGCGFLLKPTLEGAIRDSVSEPYVAVYVLRGSGTYIDWDGHAHRMTAGCVAQRLPGRCHSTIQEPDGQWTECFVVLHRDVFETLVRFGTMDAARPLLWPGLHLSLVEQFEAILAELAQGSGQVSPRTLLRAHELVVSMYALDAAARAPDPHAELVQAACDLLGENVEERSVLPALAGSFGMSYERFRKVFRERVGVAPGAYRIRRRVERACQLLREEHLSVKEAAFALGYADIYSFSRQFRQVMGTPPGAFRNGVR